MRSRLYPYYFLTLTMLCISLAAAANLGAHEWMAPEAAAARQNPIPSSESSINIGKVIYVQNCGSCHGRNGQGLGPGDTGLSKETPNLVLRLKNHPDGDFHWKIQTGKDEMPPFQDDLADSDIWNVIHYIRSLAKQRAAD